jgi:phosphoenolpyruvate phosphomutase
MQRTARELAESQSLLAVEQRVAPLAEVFRLQGADELARAEERYLPRPSSARAVVLAASRGKQLGELTVDRPKTLVAVRGRPLLEQIVDAYNAVGVKDLTVVRGYKKEAFDQPNLRFVDNDEYESTGELWSLDLALRALEDDGGDVVVSYGDVLFGKFVPEILCATEGELAIVVDTGRQRDEAPRVADWVRCSVPYTPASFYERVTLERIAESLPEGEPHGEWMGFLKIAAGALPDVRATVERLLADPANRGAKLVTLLNTLVANGRRVDVVYTSGHWVNVNSIADVVRAGSFA